MGKNSRNNAFNPETEPEGRYIVYTDGGCAFNPGGPGGFGAVIVDTESGEINELSGGYFASTNNRMELMAMIAALSKIPKNESVTLYSDSRYALGILTGQYMPSKNFDLAMKLREAGRGKRISACWVQGHSGVDLNEKCDTLATEAMSAPTLEDEGFDPSEMKRRVQNPGVANGGSMAVKIELPENLEKFFPEPGKYKVKENCAAGIRRLNGKGKLSFKDFMNLKTGGIDGWSRADTEKEFGEDVKEYVESFFPQEQRVKSCLKWYGRGLALDLAVRKELVSQEIDANARGAGW